MNRIKAIKSSGLRLALLFVVCQLFYTQHAQAQLVADQIWLEYRPTYTFAPKFKIDGRASFRDEFDETNWHTWEARLLPVLKLSKGFDVNMALSFLETSQNLNLSTFEFRIAPGVRYKLPWKRVELGVWARAEFRWVYKREAEEWTYSTRPRLRVFTDIPINAKSMKEERFFYVASFLEFFYQNDEDIQERYSNRFWFRVGLGYKLNKKLRFELSYTRQDSKNTIRDEFDDLTKQNLFVFAVKHNLN
jgi:hypothetical protein